MIVLIIGLGSIANKHIVALKSLDSNITIYALRSAHSPEVEGVGNIYNLDELRMKPDFVIISNPTSLHYSAISSAISLGAPIIIEKPVLHTLTGADELASRLMNENISTYVACNLRFHPCIQFLKKSALENKNINEVNIYCGSYLPDWRPGKDFNKIYSANESEGGGVHLDLFHEMDYACWLFGFPISHHGFRSNVSTLNIDASDYANYLLSYSKFNISIVLNYYRRHAKRTIEILFDNKTWIVDLIKCTIANDEGKIIYSCPDFNIIESYKNQAAYFMDCIKKDETPMNSFNESLKILKITLNG
ncbi:MAG TPA: Gfo/Idh/MocA family oxidoreductase [Mucilaginibacter sp.]|jgi:predicted dehydrogenase|nr:Gfo/Idh/MocA family oxidoreductase [Mucilaginibacter sp.]